MLYVTIATKLLLLLQAGSLLCQENKVLTRLVRRQYSKEGHPSLFNCEARLSNARDLSLPVNFEMTIAPKWTDYEEYLDDLSLPMKYTWTYRMVKEIDKDGEKIEVPVDISKFESRETASITFPTYSLSPGFYKIYPKAERKNVGDRLKPFVIKTCYINVIGLAPVAVIAGGTYRVVPSSTSIVMNGSESMDLNRSGKDGTHLKYHWTCSQKLKPPTFCIRDPVSTRDSFTIPERYVTSGDKFDVVLTVTTLYKTVAKVRQEVDVVQDAVLLEIKCQKNCPPVSEWSNTNSITYLSVICHKNCADFDDKEYTWSITTSSGQSGFDFDYERDTQFGRTGEKFIVSKNVLTAGDYLVSVDLKDGKGQAKTTLTFGAPPKVSNCVTKPPQGESLKTNFLLECDQETSYRRHFYEVYFTSNGEDIESGELIVEGFYPEILRVPFMLPSSQGRKFTVKVSKENGPFTLVPVSPQVKASFVGKSPKEILDDVKKIYEGKTPDRSLLKMMTSKEPEMREIGFQTFQALVNELVLVKSDDQEYRKFVDNLKYQAVEDLLKVPFTSVRQIMKIGDVVTKLMAYHEPSKSDPLLEKLSTTFCKKMVDKHVEMIKGDLFPLNYADISGKVTRTLTKCLESNANPDFDIIVPISLNVTTNAPILLESALVENYPDYVDFSEGQYVDMERLQMATNNIFEATALSAKTLALTAAVGEKVQGLKGKSSEILVMKDKGRVLAKSKLQSGGVVLKPSRDLAYSEHPIDILMSTWNKDILWWNLGRTRVATEIINVQFWHSSCKEKIDNFNKPTDIYFDVIHQDNFQFDSVEGAAKVPEGYSRIFHHDLNRHIQVRRVTLPHRSSLLVQFYNLSQLALYVVIVPAKFPTIEDFAHREIIKTDEKTSMVYVNPFGYDIWTYVGILPSKNATNGSTYSIGLTVTCCIRWKQKNNRWEPACMSGQRTDFSTIHCKCKHFSTMAGHIENIKSVPQEVMTTELLLKVQSTLVVFVTVASIFAIYCLLLPLVFLKRDKKAMLYFLADNLASHRYAYLVLVKTGKKGTTSHVTIKIMGKHRSTPAHVLNYPDPKIRLLQKQSKDVFVVTNEQYLGKIVHIELWVDHGGASPSWYCEEIEIYDLQKKVTWYFKVKQLFSVEKDNIYVSLEPTERELDRKRVARFLKKIPLWNSLHTWCFWAHEKHFSYVKRLTVVLSTVLMMCVMVLMLEEVPELETRDSLDRYRYEINWDTVLSAFVASFVSFTFHIVIAWIFRLSEIKVLGVEEKSIFSYSVTKTCWKILIVLVVLSLTLLTVWGFWLPHNRSMIWLTTCGIGLLFDIFIYESFLIVIMSFFYKHETVEYAGEQYDAVVSLIEQQRYLLRKHFGGNLLRSYVEHLHKPLEIKEVKEKKITEEMRQNIAEELSDLVMFTIYTIILYIVILVNKAEFTVVSKNEIQSMFEGQHTRTLAFTSIRSVKEVYDYINQTLIPVMQPVDWYPNVTISEPGMMVDFANKYIGIARFRQQRIATNVCEVVDSLRFLNVDACRPEFTPDHEELGSFGYGWGNHSSFILLDRLRTIWIYLDQHKTETLGFIGEISTYSGGGYVAYLGRNLRNSYLNFKKIVDKFWVDRRTRGFFIEFLAYNTNYNLFNAVRLLFEQSATGYISNTIEIYSVRMVFVHNEMEQVAIVFFLLFVVWVLILLLKRSIGVIKHFRIFYKNFWFIIDLIIITMSLTCISMFVIRLKMVGEYLDALENLKHNDFIGYFTLFYIEDFLTVCTAFLVLISTVRLWKFLRFGLFFRIMETTLSSAAFPLLSATLAFFVVLMAFGLSGVLIFGNEFPELSTLLKIVATLIILSLKPDQFDITDFIEKPLDYWYFSVYLVLMQIILFIYIIIIIMSYVKAKLDFSVEAAPYRVSTFIQEQTRYIPKIFKQRYDRISGGQEDKKLVKPKGDEFRYANSLSTQSNTLKSMKFITKCVMRNSEKGEEERENLTDYDVELMLEVSRGVLKSHEEDKIEIFFKGHFVGERIRVVDEERITTIAEVVELMLSPKRKKPSAKGQVGVVKKYQQSLMRCALELQKICNEIDKLES